MTRLIFGQFWQAKDVSTRLPIYHSEAAAGGVRKGVPRNFAKFKGKHLCQRLFFNKVAALGPATLLKKSLRHRRFPVNFAKFLRAPFLQNTSGRLLLTFHATVC